MMVKQSFRPQLESLESRLAPATFAVDFMVCCFPQAPPSFIGNSLNLKLQARDGTVFGHVWNNAWNANGEPMSGLEMRTAVKATLEAEGWSVTCDPARDTWFRVNGHGSNGNVSPVLNGGVYAPGLREQLQPNITMNADSTDTPRATLNLEAIFTSAPNNILKEGATLHVVIGTNDVAVNLSAGWNVSQCLSAASTAFGAAGLNPTTNTDGSISFDVAGTSSVQVNWVDAGTSTDGGLYADLTI